MLVLPPIGVLFVSATCQPSHLSVIEGESSQMTARVEGVLSCKLPRTCLLCLDDSILDGLCQSPTWLCPKC